MIWEDMHRRAEFSDHGAAFPEGRVEVSGGEYEIESRAWGRWLGLEFKGIALAWNFYYGNWYERQDGVIPDGVFVEGGP